MIVAAPIGFVKAGDRLEKDPDRRVQAAVGLVFDKVAELGSGVYASTICRWVQRYAPDLQEHTAWHRSRLSFSWQVDETSSG